jgi:hypothetical protein
LARSRRSADADDLIDMFEAWVNRSLRVPQMEQESTTPASEYLALPTDFLELRDIQWQGSPRVQLEYATPAYADLYDTSGSAGTPQFYTIVGDQLRLIPAPDATTDVRITYWKKITPLSDSNTSNWLLSLYPDAYLYGSLVHGRVRISDVQTAAIVGQAWEGVMNEVRKAGRNSNLGSLLRTKVA